MAKLLGVEPETVHELAAHVDAAMSVCEIGDEEVSRRWSALCTMVIDILHRKLAEPGDDLLTAGQAAVAESRAHRVSPGTVTHVTVATVRCARRSMRTNSNQLRSYVAWTPN